MTENSKKILQSKDRPWRKYYTEEQLNASVPQCTLYEYLKNNNKDRLDSIALNYFDKEMSYRKLLEDIDLAAEIFIAAGVKRGDTVSVCMLTMPETVCIFYALNKIGAVCNLIEPRTNPTRIRDHINNSKSKMLFVVDVFVGKINEIINELNVDKIVIVPLANSMPLATKIGFKLTKGRKLPKPAEDKRYISWNNFLTKCERAFVSPAPYTPNWPAAIVYTGGTTGLPKGAILTNDSFNALTVEYRNNGMEYKPGQTFLNIMPPFISYGVSCGLNMPLCIGLKMIIIAAFKPEDFAGYVMKYKPNHFIGVPSHFERLINAPETQDADLSFVMTAAAGGDSMSLGVEEKINAFFAAHNCKHHIIRGYGMTELGSAASTTSDIADKPESVGIPLPLAAFSVHDPETGEELGANEDGELYALLPTRMKEYLNNPEETAKILFNDDEGNEWIKTGDIGHMDEDGFIFIKGRKKRVIIRPDGHNVWPSQIEAVLSQYPGVKEVATVGLDNPDGEHGKLPTAFIVADDGARNDCVFLQKIEKYAKTHLPERDTPYSYRFIDELPLTAVGKVDYRALEKTKY